MSDLFLEPADFFRVFKMGATFLDVRSEGEFLEGAFDGVQNIPILNNTERHEVGLCYKSEGSDAAIALGHRLVSGKVKEQRIQQWIDCIQKQSPVALFCWRGGMRSKLAQFWLKELGISIPRVRGGYKALRNFFIQFQSENISTMKVIVVSGRTGSGKTQFLRGLRKTEAVIDFEQIAHHRGSAFGAMLEPQPSQATFENNITIEMIKNIKHDQNIFVEAESRAIGTVHIPIPFFEKMQSAPIIVIDAPIEERVVRILNEYVRQPFEMYWQVSCETAVEQLKSKLESNLRKIKDRLGGLRFSEVQDLLNEACTVTKPGEFEAHKRWIVKVLEYYYDPYYEKSLLQRSDKIISVNDIPLSTST